MSRSVLGHQRFQARGVASNRAGRFEANRIDRVFDEWYEEEPVPRRIDETVLADRARSLITTNDSPDVGFEASINPYRGCSHGCIYCFARPSHSYLGLSPGLDFETKLFYKDNAGPLLEAELARPGYAPKPIALGINTDAYQPLEKRLGVTRSVLTVLARYRHPVSLITKSALILRDRDLLKDLARDRLVSVMLSVTSLSDEIKRSLEPRTASPEARLRVLRELATEGIPVGVMVAPVIPAITDHEIEDILAAAREAGATCAGYVLLRLPHEVKDLFREWLSEFYPDRAKHVMSLLQQSHGGKDYDSRFGHRMRGSGPYADLLHTRFRLARRKLGLESGDERHRLNTSAFRPPAPPGGQLSLGF
jgi:DNA repair photolyase